jgi:hypothetical protein
MSEATDLRELIDPFEEMLRDTLRLEDLLLQSMAITEQMQGEAAELREQIELEELGG